MADNTTLNPGAGGDDIRTVDKTSYKTPTSLIDVGGTGSENLVEDGVQGIPAEGVAAENAAVAGNPVLIGGRYDSSSRTLGDGDVGAIALTAAGEVMVSGGGTQYTEDAAAASDPVGTISIVVRADSLSAVTDTDGDNIALRGTNKGELYVKQTDSVPVTDNGGSITVDNGGTFATQVTSSASGGATPGRLISAASTNATSIKASAGTLYSFSATNVNAAICYVKFYDKASVPTVGTDTPVLVYGVPGNTAGAGHAAMIPTCGIEFSTGIALAITTGAADSDTGAVSANEVVLGYSYE